MSEVLEKTTRINFLFDFYKALLTPKQQSYLELYYLEDHSLGEISESYGISRQAVYDNIKRTEAILEDYEKKLKLHEKFTNRLQMVRNLQLDLSEMTEEQVLNILEKIKNID